MLINRFFVRIAMLGANKSDKELLNLFRSLNDLDDFNNENVEVVTKLKPNCSVISNLKFF